MTEITYGTENVFSSVLTQYIDVAVLDETHFVVAYRGAANKGYAAVGSISGDTITFGTPVEFTVATPSYISVAALDSTHFVVGYERVDLGCCRIGVVSGTTISSFGTENVFNSVATRAISIDTLDSTHFVVTYVYYSSVYNGTARVGVVSGTTISSYGTANGFGNVDDTISLSVAALDSTHFVVAYHYEWSGFFGQARVGVVSGTTISSYGAINIFNSARTRYISVDALDSAHFVVAYTDDGGDDYGIARVGLVSGTTISSYGSENIFNSALTYTTSVATFDNLYFIISYDDGFSDKGTDIIGEVDGTTIIEYGSEYIFNDAITYSPSNATFNDTHFVVVYRDYGGSSYGCARIGSFPVQFTPQVIIS